MPKTNNAPMAVDFSVDHTDRRIRAYLAQTIPLEGNEIPEVWHRGRAIIEELANSASGTNAPAKALSLAEVADVLGFMHNSQVRDVGEYHADRDDTPNVQCGLMEVLQALEASLRKHGSGRRR